jgi:hypothetical protein
VTNVWADPVTRGNRKRAAPRQTVALPARLTWKDQRGMTRFASVMMRDVSDTGAYVDCQTPVSIPLFRLVHLQLEREARDTEPLPAAIRQGRILAAIYRITPASSSGQRQGLALRLMVDPKRLAVHESESHAVSA